MWLLSHSFQFIAVSEFILKLEVGYQHTAKAFTLIHTLFSISSSLINGRNLKVISEVYLTLKKGEPVNKLKFDLHFCDHYVLLFYATTQRMIEN